MEVQSWPVLSETDPESALQRCLLEIRMLLRGLSKEEDAYMPLCFYPLYMLCTFCHNVEIWWQLLTSRSTSG